MTVAESDTATILSRTKPGPVTWGYAAENGPDQWGTLSEDWQLCATGQSQSPIAISYREAVAAGDTPRPMLKTAPAKFAVRLREAAPGAANRSLVAEPYIPRPPPLVGDAPPVDTYTPPPPAALITIPDVATYTLRSLHFHVDSSEHVLDGTRGVLEAHFVFEMLSRAPPSSGSTSEAKVSEEEVVPPPAEAADAQQTLVVGVMGLPGEKSEPWLEEVVDKIPIITAEDARPSGIVMDLDLGMVLPDFARVDLYSYSGSLTTPPGTEGVCWIVVGERVQVSQAELNSLVSLQGGANVRPLQPLNERKVMRFPAVPVEDA